MKTLVVGHRGASCDAPENTLASFRLAFEQGADGIEADFRLTRDGEIVCLHDRSAKRTAGVPLLAEECALPQLSRLDVGAWKGDAWRGQSIPTLDQVLALLPAGKMLFIELKSGPAIIPPLERVLASSEVPAQQIRLLCFDEALIASLKERLPDYRSCWLTDYRFRGLWRPTAEEVFATARRVGADGVASRACSVVDRALVETLHAAGLEIHLWTVDAAARARLFAALGVDSIMTNRPAFLRRALARPATP